MTEPVFREDSRVEVRYPLNNEQKDADRDGWPWLSGWVVPECGPDEWEICVQAPHEHDHSIIRDGCGQLITGVLHRARTGCGPGSARIAVAAWRPALSYLCAGLNGSTS